MPSGSATNRCEGVAPVERMNDDGDADDDDDDDDADDDGVEYGLSRRRQG